MPLILPNAQAAQKVVVLPLSKLTFLLLFSGFDVLAQVLRTVPTTVGPQDRSVGKWLPEALISHLRYDMWIWWMQAHQHCKTLQF
jgi:hypothetical protein